MAALDYFSLSESTLKELADKGDLRAKLALGMNYYYSVYGPHPVVEAYSYLVSAYNEGERQAAPVLGEIIYFKQVSISGYDSDEDYFSMAHGLFKEAAENEMMAGWRGLAKMLIRGDYLERDLETALHYLETLKDLDGECAHLSELLRNGVLTLGDIVPNVDFVKGNAAADASGTRENVAAEEEGNGTEEQEEADGDGFNWKEYSNEDEMIAAWLSIDTPQEDGFDLPLTVEELMKDLDWDIELDIDNDKFGVCGDFEGETVRDLLLEVIKGDAEDTEKLIGLARVYRTMDGWELNKAAYWAHKAAILTRRLIGSDSIGYMDGCEILCNALGELGNAYFSYPCHEDDTEYFPNLELASKYYREAAEADTMNEYDFNIMAGRAMSALGFGVSQIELTMLEKGFDRSKGLAWSGQMWYERGMIKPALEKWNESIKGSSGWGEYFLGRYYWGRKYYSDAITLWKEGEKKGCAECSGELFNWIVGHPESTASQKQEQWDKAMSLTSSGRCTSVYKYIYKHITNGNIVLSFPEDPDCDRLGIDRSRLTAANAINKGIKEFCPYCAKIYKEDLSHPNAGLAMKAWGFDGNVY